MAASTKLAELAELLEQGPWRGPCALHHVPRPHSVSFGLALPAFRRERLRSFQRNFVMLFLISGTAPSVIT